MWLLWIWLIWWALSFLPPIPIRAPVPAIAMTIMPFIFYNPRYEHMFNSCVWKHEMRHALQQRILSPLVMLILYGLNYLILRLKYSHWEAYRRIIFEVDAWKNGCDPFNVLGRRDDGV